MTDLLGTEVHVDVTSIERQLADLWRGQNVEGETAVTRAALWNVVAHTWNASEHARAAEVLSRAGAAVPQRTIIVQADPRGEAEISSSISANCHLIGGGRHVCSEEIAIRAAGERVHHIPPLVKALLLPDMPVAVWWVGDLPRDHHEYAETLLDPADRLIVDSSQFTSADDLELVSRIAEQTTTAPADLTWARLEEWRAATASLFDPPPMRERFGEIRSIRVVSGGDGSFGANAEALLFVAWMAAQLAIDVPHELVHAGTAAGIQTIEITFSDGKRGLIQRDRERGAVIAHTEGAAVPLDCIARALAHDTDDLIVRLLKRPEADRVYLKTLKIARRLAA